MQEQEQQRHGERHEHLHQRATSPQVHQILGDEDAQRPAAEERQPTVDRTVELRLRRHMHLEISRNEVGADERKPERKREGDQRNPVRVGELVVHSENQHLQGQHLQSEQQRGADPEQVMTEMARLLTNKLLHEPSVQLKQMTAQGRVEALALAQELFALGDSAPGNRNNSSQGDS